MPIKKVPMVHRFGIISHSQRLELQERLLKQSYLETYATRKSTLQSRNPFEVTEEFIQNYNATEELEDREKLDSLAYKMMHRIKRRAGLKDGGTGEHVDLPMAWTELSQLAQCKGKIQEECLDVLITSLDQAPLEKMHIPALFFLAETTLYWLRTDAVHQPFLRTGEIKLLRMGQLVFVRLFYHHMAGQLQRQDDFKNRLFTYLDGFAESQEAYSPYPNALLCVRYINEVGKIIIGNCNMEAGEIKEGDKVTGHSSYDETETEMFREASVHYEDTQEDSRSSHSAAISSSVHDLSPTLWHALDVWRCVNQLGGGLNDAVKSLASCGMGLATESWVDGVTAMQVLGDAAKSNLQVLKALETLAQGVKPPQRPASGVSTCSSKNSRQENDSLNDYSNEPILDKPGKTRSLSDIFEKPETAGTSAGRSQSQKHSDPTHDSFPEKTQLSEMRPPNQIPNPASKQVTIVDDRNPSNLQTNKTFMSTNYTTAPNTAWKAEVGTELGTEGRGSQASTVATYSNPVHTDLPGLHGWHWEVAIWYADTLADVCLHGATSTIQKTALVGLHKEVGIIHKTAFSPECPLKSAGLLDLVYFHAAREQYDGSSRDWSWRVRYAAIQGLVKICRCLSSDSTKEGMRTVAWNTLVKAHSLERDQRVLEALKVGQVESNIENLLSQSTSTIPETIGAKLAAGLSLLYLPALPLPVEGRRPKKSPPKPVSLSPPKQPSRQEPKKQVRTTLKQEIMLATVNYEPAPAFNTRTSFDLKRIVEDQWRKQLQIELTEEEEENRKCLEEKHKQDEENLKKIEQQRKEKLGGKYKGKAYQVKDFSKTDLGRKQSSATGSGTRSNSLSSDLSLQSKPLSLHRNVGREISSK